MTKTPKANKYLLKFLYSRIQKDSTLLDIGCGPKIYSNPFKDICSEILTIDAWHPTNPDILLNVEKESILPYLNNKKYDYILLLDFIEHLEKEAGNKLIEDCKLICSQEIIMLTPCENIWTSNKENVQNPSLWSFNNVYDMHKSIWAESDFIGWNKIDLTGFKDYLVYVWKRND